MSFQFRIGKYAAYAYAIWAILTLLNAVYYFAIPHGQGFASPLGLNASFLVFHTLLSAMYFVLAIGVGLALHFISHTDRSDDAGA